MTDLKSWRLIILFIFLLINQPSVASSEESRFSVGYTSGYYDPSLKTFNKIIGDRRIAILQDPNFLMPGNVTEDNRGDRNIRVSDIRAKINYGVETQWKINPKHSFLFTVSVWNGKSIGKDIYQLPILSLENTVDAPRSARYNLIIDQFWLGWRYNIFKDKNKGELYTNIELIGISLSYLTIDSLTKVMAPDFNLNFISISSTEAKGVAYTTRFGIGSEYFLARWVSIGLRLNYVLGKVVRLKVERYFPPNFPVVVGVPPQAGNVQPEPPPEPRGGDVITFGIDTSANVTRTINQSQNLPLELNGPELSATIRFFF